MYSINRKSTLFWKLNPTTFKSINSNVVGFDVLRLGSARKPVNTMLSQGEELRMIMPIILATTPESSSSNWDELVAKYWHSLCVLIPSSGLNLEIGFNFSIDDSKRQKFLKPLLEEKKIKTDKDLAEYVMGFKNEKPNVAEEEKYKYGSPINPEEYLWWRYSLIHREVANNVLDINKSPMIRFYLHSDQEQKQIEKQKLDVARKAIEVYNNIITSDTAPTRIEELVYYLMQDQLSIVDAMDDDQKQIKILEFVKDKPSDFVYAAQDKSLSIKVEILKLIQGSIFRKVGGTNLIVDASDSSVIIGDGMEDAVTYMKNTVNKEKVELYKSKLKSLVG